MADRSRYTIQSLLAAPDMVGGRKRATESLHVEFYIKEDNMKRKPKLWT
jgi:hypothetical protein